MALTGAPHLPGRPWLRTFLGLALIGALGAGGHYLLVRRDLRLAAEATDPAIAAGALARAAVLRPWDAGLHAQAGQAALQAGQFETAQRYLLRAIALGNNTPETYIALGDAFAAAGDWAEAIKEWEIARLQTPSDAGLLRRLARAYEARGEFTQAADALRGIAAAKPDDAPSLYRLALILAAADPPAARAPLSAAVAADESLQPATAQLESALRAGELSEHPAYEAGRVAVALIGLEEWALAGVSLDRALALDPNYGEAYAYRGLVRDRLGQDGLDDYQRAIALAPDSALAHALLGLHWRRAGQNALAILELERAYDLDPQNAAICAELGGAYGAAGNVTAAELWFKEAVRLAPENGDFWTLLAQFYLGNEIAVRELGLPAALNAVAYAPESAAAHDALGWALYLTGTANTAEKELARALELDPDLAAAHYHLGVLRAALGQSDEARAAFTRALELDPQGRYGLLAGRALERLGP